MPSCLRQREVCTGVMPVRSSARSTDKYCGSAIFGWCPARRTVERHHPTKSICWAIFSSIALSKIFGLQPGVFGDARQHRWPDLDIVVEGEDIIRRTGSF